MKCLIIILYTLFLPQDFADQYRLCDDKKKELGTLAITPDQLYLILFPDPTLTFKVNHVIDNTSSITYFISSEYVKGTIVMIKINGIVFINLLIDNEVHYDRKVYIKDKYIALKG